MQLFRKNGALVKGVQRTFGDGYRLIYRVEGGSAVYTPLFGVLNDMLTFEVARSDTKGVAQRIVGQTSILKVESLEVGNTFVVELKLKTKNVTP